MKSNWIENDLFRPPRVREGFLLLFMAFVTLGLYYPAILGPLCLLDDRVLALDLLNNPSWSYVKSLFALREGGIYQRPLSTLVCYAMFRVFGLASEPFHLFNVLVHLGSGLLIYFMIKRLYAAAASGTLLAFTAAMIFLVHPINVEAVAWISGRPTVMATFFVLLAFFFHLRVQNNLKDWRLWSAALCYLLSLLTYELAAAMPLVFVYWDLDQKDGNNWRQAARSGYRRWLPYGLVLALYIVYRVLKGLAVPGAEHQGGSLLFSVLEGFMDNLGSPFVALGFYLKKVFWPWPLNIYIAHISPALRPFYLVLGLFFPLALGCWVWRRSWLRFWGFWFLCGLAVVVPLSFHSFSWTPAAERYVYLSSMAFAVSISLLVFEKLASQPRWVVGTTRVLLLALLVVFGIGTTKRSITWQSDLSLAQDTWRQNPRSGKVAGFYANALYNTGHTKEAVAYWKEAIALGNVSEPAHSLGDLEKARKHYESAEKYYLRSLWPITNLGKEGVRRMSEVNILNERDPKVYLALADLHKKMAAEEPGRESYHQERIIHYYKAACKLEPENAYFRYILAKAYLGFGNVDEARENFARVSEMAPDTYYGRAAAKLAMAERMSSGQQVSNFHEYMQGLRKNSGRR